MNEKAGFFFPVFFPSKKLNESMILDLFLGKKKNKKTHKSSGDKNQTFIKKKETSSKSDRMTEDLYFFSRFAEKKKARFSDLSE